MINSIRDFFRKTEDPRKQKLSISDKINQTFYSLKFETPEGYKKLTFDEIMHQMYILQHEVQNLKKEGISLWNPKPAIARIFDIVDGAFVVMIELAEHFEGEKK